MTFIEVAEQKGFSPSYTRMRVFNYMKDYPEHPTVDDIYQALKPEIPSLSKTTVYNVLKLFITHDLVMLINTDDSLKRYELKLEDHSHFICTSCNKIIDIPLITIPKGQLSNYHVSETEVILKGVCRDCQEN